MSKFRRIALIVVVLLVAAGAGFAAKKNTKDIADIPLGSGHLRFAIEGGGDKRQAKVYARDNDGIQSVYMVATPADLKAIAKAVEDTLAELNKPAAPAK
jgi:hypothetical protein